jgi:hypothetical protein
VNDFERFQLQINIIGFGSSESLYRHPRTQILHDQRFLEDDLAGTSSDDCNGHEFRRIQKSLFVSQSNVTSLINLFFKRKCAEYWPQRLNCIFECGEMGITLKSEENFEHYDRRTLEMNYRGEVRAVQHYHLKWNPDQLTPLYPDRVVPLVKQIRNIRENSTTPIVIHCR